MQREADASWSLLNRALLVVLALLAALHWGLRPNPNTRGLEFLPNMARAIPAEAFSANPVLAGGMTLQSPPAGTIARGRPPLHLTATVEDALRAGETLENPFSLDDPAAVARGQVVYSRDCLLCHGPSGAGDGTVAQRGFPAPPSLLATNARQMRDGQIFHIVTFGQGNMPSHATQIEPADRWRAVLRVREFQRDAEPTAEPVPAPGTEAVETAATRGEINSGTNGVPDSGTTSPGDTP